MKRLIILIAFAIASLPLYSQSIAFPDSFAMWYDQGEVIGIEPGHGASQGYFECQLFEMNGDTILNGQSYNKIYLHDEDSLTKSFYVGMRSDSLNRVFVFIPDSSAEYIIYDFSFVEGDSITLTYPYYRGGTWHDTTTIILDEVDTIFLYGAMRKRVRVHPWFTPEGDFNSSWIEGVGSSMGLLYYEFESSAKTTLSCKSLVDFSLDGNITYHCGDVICLPLGVDEPASTTPAIFPNPIQQQGDLTVQVTITHPFQITITNIFGQNLWHSRHKYESRATIHPQLAPGIYFVNVSVSGQLFTSKLVVEF